MNSGARVVIVHDYLTQRGGAERVALAMLRSFPGARLVTSFWNPSTTYPEFAGYEIETLPLDRLAALRRDPRRAFPLLGRAFGRHHIADADVVICSSSGWAHRVSTDAPKIVYCHNPARWLYQTAEYLPSAPPWAVRLFRATHGRLQVSDFVAAREAKRYLVNSTTVARRVRDTYGITPGIVPPPVEMTPDGPQEPVPGVTPGYLLTISRARAYKHAAAIVDAVSTMPGERLVVVGGEHAYHSPRVTRVCGLGDAQLRWLYANASGLVAAAQEDFGLTPVEAQQFGIPCAALRAGGYLDTTVPGVTGVFFDHVTPEDIAAGIRELRTRSWDPAKIREQGRRYSPAIFGRRMHAAVAAAMNSAAPRSVAELRTAVSSPPDPADVASA